MRRTCAILLTLFCTAFTECTSGKVTLDTAQPISSSEANFWCSFYTSTVVYGQATHLCLDEINALGEDGANAWFEESVRIVQDDCTNYVNNAPEPEDIEYVVKYVCRDGYDEENPDISTSFETLTCDDITSDNFVLTWPYEDLCPCIDDGLVEFVDGQIQCDTTTTN